MCNARRWLESSVIRRDTYETPVKLDAQTKKRKRDGRDSCDNRRHKSFRSDSYTYLLIICSCGGAVSRISFPGHGIPQILFQEDSFLPSRAHFAASPWKVSALPMLVCWIGISLFGLVEFLRNASLLELLIIRITNVENSGYESCRSRFEAFSPQEIVSKDDRSYTHVTWR